MPNIDIIQLVMILKLVLGYPNFSILGQSHQAHMIQPNTTITQSHTKHNIKRTSHYSRSFTINEISFILQFLA
jgi:hypothetical protein